MKVVICWTSYSGYMAACWRELAAIGGVDVHVLCITGEGVESNTAFVRTMPAGVSHSLLSEREHTDPAKVRAVVEAQRPDVVVIPGWSQPSYTRLIDAPGLSRARFVLAMDTPYRGDLRQQVARLWLARLLRRIDRVVVAGERAREYARRLGVSLERIDVGLYAYDQSMFNATLLERRSSLPGGWPRRFLFVGRYVPEKAVDVLVEAYRAYRDEVADPWELGCCGKGWLGERLVGVPGIRDHGFVQPADQPELFLHHGAFVLPSRYEPWGVAVAEAMASGLPAICSSSCNAALSLLHSYWNGIEIPPGDPRALARAMRWMHDHPAALPAMGHEAAGVATAYSARQWAVRWRETLQAALDSGVGR
jgi:glycosyltransferase involved in cell wall biosynthesis